MRLLHTSDWHLGQTFHSYERSAEHAHFLGWLLQQLIEQEPDVLVIAGDIFDTANPSAAAQQQFYRFISAALKQQPDINIIITAGNHDSAHRLEAPSPILRELGVTLIGTVPRNEDGLVDVRRLVIPLGNKNSNPTGWCVALPFLRPGDLPRHPEMADHYQDGVAALYEATLQHAVALRGESQLPIIGIGHLHLVGGEVSELSERRLIVGGNEALSANIFGDAFSYVALGHLHKAQQVGHPHIRYCGSPLPMSFSEIDYTHQVVLVDFEGCAVTNIMPLIIPRSVPLLRLPKQRADINDVLAMLTSLELPEASFDEQPYLEVRVALRQPEPDLRRRIEEALTGKPVRLVRIDAQIVREHSNEQPLHAHGLNDMQQIQPLEVFRNIYETTYGTPPKETLIHAFAELASRAQHEEISA
ncbi:exonuclease SbcCD subunit D C-terminal domain-containing protein [Chitinilyticum piscinae]|uniref:Nuclease SbcCD subunit D n=1 Tax=Chitinilyticum piscinae TaxID=2866724 RepID=A0A8J7K343_9NEIS|nr:exonuclease SbcCD subunit D C-terminal domain-containing protein [Chitinilyticum piscinae]MBE9610867.1 exonuclease SbcCD subunit D C-terminal domain-containing protein [Chitinilyticum piscinae]